MFNLITNAATNLSNMWGALHHAARQSVEAETIVIDSNTDNHINAGRGDGPNGECLTCDSRRYVDDSSDGGVSFQMPTHISPEASFSEVRAHEYEHIRRDRAAAELRGEDIVYQRVTFRVSFCPECGMIFKAGGTATTVSRSNAADDTQGIYFDDYV